MDRHKPHLVPKWVIYGFFVLGLVSAISFRAIIVLKKIEPSLVRPVWYVGAVGYMLFFLYRTHITRKRKSAIQKYRLIEKVKTNACLSDEDREVLGYLLSSLEKSPEEFNYFLIFIISIIAVVIDILI